MSEKYKKGIIDNLLYSDWLINTLYTSFTCISLDVRWLISDFVCFNAFVDFGNQALQGDISVMFYSLVRRVVERTTLRVVLATRMVDITEKDRGCMQYNEVFMWRQSSWESSTTLSQISASSLRTLKTSVLSNNIFFF